MEGLFPKDEPISFKSLVLEPNENWGVEVENQQFSRFAIENGTFPEVSQSLTKADGTLNFFLLLQP